MHLPPLYPITDTRQEGTLSAQILRLGEAGFPLVQFRGKPLSAAGQWAELEKALGESARRGGWPAICLNDRADLALLAARDGLAPWGLHLGQRDFPPAEARRLPGLEQLHLGTSTHRSQEWEHPDPACDHAGVGPFRATATKGDHEPPLGPEGLQAGCAALRARGIAPIAIGGLTVDDFSLCFQAGAEAVAAVGEVARSARPQELLWQAQVARWGVRPPCGTRRGVVLIGGSGAGKSSLARCLGPRLGLPALDTDAWLEARTGKPAGQLIQEEGEPAFRRLEFQAVRACLERPAVVALGGGAWEEPAARETVEASGFDVLWLAEVPDRAWARVGGDPSRPLAADRAGFLSRWARRTPSWSLAPMVLPLGRTPGELAEALAR
jgi:thiamine-phosphate pyrophosphorylase